MAANFALRAAAAVTRPARRTFHQRRKAIARRRHKHARAGAHLAVVQQRWHGTKQAFIFEGIAVLVLPWHEDANPSERGARVEVRLLEEQPYRGSVSAGQRLVIDEPRFRADIFDRLDRPPGNLESAHFHPTFDGVEPSEREWSEHLQQQPTAWLAETLSDLPGLLKRSGGIPLGATWLDSDAAALRAAVPAIVAAVDDTLRRVRHEDPPE